MDFSILHGLVTLGCEYTRTDWPTTLSQASNYENMLFFSTLFWFCRFHNFGRLWRNRFISTTLVIPSQPPFSPNNCWRRRWNSRTPCPFLPSSDPRKPYPSIPKPKSARAWCRQALNSTDKINGWWPKKTNLSWSFSGRKEDNNALVKPMYFHEEKIYMTKEMPFSTSI